MTLFEKIFNKVLQEDFNTAGAGGVFGSGAEIGMHGGAVPGGSDFYAPNDARIPTILGKKKKRKTKKRKSRKKGKRKSKTKRKRKSKVKEFNIPIIRR